MTAGTDWIEPEWPAPARVRALVTTRHGGISQNPYADLNLGTRVGDDPQAVAENRARVRARLPSEPVWLHQVHGVEVVQADQATTEPVADAAFTSTRDVVCAIQIADCMPVLLCDRDGTRVAAAHAGWRGLAAGVLERTVAALGLPPGDLVAWLGPAIGPRAFEVGVDVFERFTGADPTTAAAFLPLREGKWLADLFALARARLSRAGVREVLGGGLCTFTDPVRFFSHRRDRVTGRQAAFIWIAGE
jgi:purine-nucleoside/S-methyl-5'-thioadenosine phosphorylase / adenosine deaminase